MGRAGMAAVLCLFVGACGGGGKAAPGGTAATTPAEPAAPVVASRPAEPPPPPPPDDEGAVLLDAGSGTPAALRYAIKDKTKRKVSLTLTMGLPDAKPTAKKMAWTYDLKRDGDGFRIAMKITAADPPLKGLKGTWAVSARGRQAAPTSEKSAQQLLVGTQAAHLMPQFPEAPVGVGARWTAPVSVVAGVGVGEVPGTTTWELVAVDGTAVTVRGALEVHAKDFMFRDTKMDLDVTATFETHLDLTTYVGEGKMEMELTGTPEGGQAIAYASTLDLILK